MHYPSSENKGDDQLRGYREADLRLCFRICRLLVFPWDGSFNVQGNNMEVIFKSYQNSAFLRFCIIQVLSFKYIMKQKEIFNAKQYELKS